MTKQTSIFKAARAASQSILVSSVRDLRHPIHILFIVLLSIFLLAGCTKQERTSLPVPQDGNGSVIDLRNDGYFERLNQDDDED